MLSPRAEHFKVEFETTVNGGDKFVVEVTRDWSPEGSDRFYDLVQDGFYNEAGFFRVVPKFVVQFGLAAGTLDAFRRGIFL